MRVENRWEDEGFPELLEVMLTGSPKRLWQPEHLQASPQYFPLAKQAQYSLRHLLLAHRHPISSDLSLGVLLCIMEQSIELTDSDLSRFKAT